MQKRSPRNVTKNWFLHAFSCPPLFFPFSTFLGYSSGYSSGYFSSYFSGYFSVFWLFFWLFSCFFGYSSGYFLAFLGYSSVYFSAFSFSSSDFTLKISSSASSTVNMAGFTGTPLAFSSLIMDVTGGRGTFSVSRYSFLLP